MKFSYNWLQTYFAEPLPSPKDLAEQITFHSSEIEELIECGSDTVLDVKVLPDKSAWLMSHRGLAKDIAVILKRKLVIDQFESVNEVPVFGPLSVELNTKTCDFYAAALISGISIKPSPAWLKERLEAIGQRSINNIVDATNYVMFELGQPLHAFAADKLTKSENGQFKIGVRQALDKEEITTLTGEGYTLSANDAVIIDGVTNVPIAIAGVKGGKVAAVDQTTTDIIIEAAHFSRVAVRNTAKRLRLQTDAAKRYENGIRAGVVPIALIRVVELIKEIAGGDVEAQNYAGSFDIVPKTVSCTLTKINSALGLQLKQSEVESILGDFGYAHEFKEDTFIVTVPFERDDLVIAEDLIEEVGRMHGLHHIASIIPPKIAQNEYNARHFYAERIRQTLIELGFSEVYTSSFRNTDIVRLENALATDKGYLRSTLVNNLSEARDLNIPNRDLLGLRAIKIFEIGTVFLAEKEEFRVALAVQSGTTYKEKVDGPLLSTALAELANTLGLVPTLISNANGVAEFSLEQMLPLLPKVTGYDSVTPLPKVTYRTFSNYPASSRDVAMWVSSETDVSFVAEILKRAAGPVCVRITHLDTFAKEGKLSLAFRLVFQSLEKTLTDEEIQVYMDEVYKAVEKAGYLPR